MVSDSSMVSAVSPPTRTSTPGSGKAAGAQLAQFAHGIDRLLAERIAFDRDGDDREITGLVGLRLGAAEPRLAGQLLAQALDPGLDGRRVGVAVDHDLDRLGALARELGVQGHIPLLGGEPIRKRAHPRLARPQTQHRGGHHEQNRRGQHETEHRPPQHGADRARPEPALLAVRGAPEDR